MNGSSKVIRYISKYDLYHDPVPSSASYAPTHKEDPFTQLYTNIDIPLLDALQKEFFVEEIKPLSLTEQGKMKAQYFLFEKRLKFKKPLCHINYPWEQVIDFF